MTISITPYLSFQANAREAMEYYHSVFGGELSMMTFAEGMGDQVDPATPDQIMHSSLYVERGFHLMGSDTPEGMPMGANGTLALSADGSSSGDNPPLREYWDKLSADGQILEPLEVAPWGDAFGMLTDRYGITWMFNLANEQA